MEKQQEHQQLSEVARVYKDAPIGLCVLDTDLRYVHINDWLAAINGLPVEAHLGRAIDEVVPDVSAGAKMQLLRVIETGEAIIEGTVDVQTPAHPGTTRTYQHNYYPIMSEDGVVIGVSCAVQDITDRRRGEEALREREQVRVEAKLQRAQKLESLGMLAGGVAHDFNNLLVGVLGNADLAMSEIPDGSPAREFVSDIVTAARRAAELCQQLLAYSGKGQFVTEPVDINDLVKETVKLLGTHTSKKADVRFELTDDMPAIMADATQIRQVLMNVFTNASEALDGGTGVISVSTGVVEFPADNYVYFEVSDTGCGMDRETQSRIFDPFFSTKLAGRGLGLAAVSGILRGHRGEMKVASQPGRGTTVRVLLPSLDRPLEPAEEGPPREESCVRGPILLVDDDQMVREVGKRMLERSGFTVLTAANGREATQVFGKHADEITCVILDLTMPEMDGKEAFHELRRLRSSIPIILSSGYNERDADDRFLDKGVASFIRKPYESRELIEKVRQALVPDDPKRPIDRTGS